MVQCPHGPVQGRVGLQSSVVGRGGQAGDSPGPGPVVEVSLIGNLHQDGPPSQRPQLQGLQHGRADPCIPLGLRQKDAGHDPLHGQAVERQVVFPRIGGAVFAPAFDHDGHVNDVLHLPILKNVLPKAEHLYSPLACSVRSLTSFPDLSLAYSVSPLLAGTWL